VTKASRKLVLCILDGWGINPNPNMNGINLAKTPTWQRLLRTYPHSQLQASEEFVGLPEGQMGNSEVGHMSIGSGRVVLQDLPLIDHAIKNHLIPQKEEFKDFIAKIQKSKGRCHVMGLLSPGGVHSHQSHLIEVCRLLTQAGIPVRVHAFLDGRDTPPKSGLGYVTDFLKAIEKLPNCSLATLGGRYYAMDRDKRWDRLQKAYDSIVHAHGPDFSDPLTFIQTSYTQGITDEFIFPHHLQGYEGIQEGDAIFMVNFRADRVRQLLTAMLIKDFSGFNRSWIPQLSATLGMAEYSEELTPYIPALFKKEEVRNTLGEVVSSHNLKQLRIAETEKYAHVTFFFNGGREELFPQEDRILIPSPKVRTYDLQPEMSAFELTDRVIQAIQEQAYDLIVMNYANTDMVGHTGIPEAILKAVEAVDTCLGRLEKACQENGYALVISADHGNAEEMQDNVTKTPHTAHTCNPVPFIVVQNTQSIKSLKDGSLSDIAPTVLDLMGMPVPPEMTGHSLIQRE
jgi:2,3-bisphosphoglycerate-independent phosphoglycerate mutase